MGAVSEKNPGGVRPRLQPDRQRPRPAATPALRLPIAALLEPGPTRQHREPTAAAARIGPAPPGPAPHRFTHTHTKKNPKSFCAKAKGGARVRSSPPAAPGPPCPPPCSAPAPRCAPPFPAQTVLWGQISFPAFAQRQFRDSVRCFKAVFENVRPFKIVMKSKRLLINGKRWKGSEAAKRHLTVPQTSVDAGGIPADTGAGGAHPTAAPGRAGTGQPHRR